MFKFEAMPAKMLQVVRSEEVVPSTAVVHSATRIRSQLTSQHALDETRFTVNIGGPELVELPPHALVLTTKDMLSGMPDASIMLPSDVTVGPVYGGDAHSLSNQYCWNNVSTVHSPPRACGSSTPIALSVREIFVAPLRL